MKEESVKFSLVLIAFLLSVDLAFAILSTYISVSGTATVTETPKWVQTTHSDFDAGTKDDVVVVTATPPEDNGDVILASEIGAEELDQNQSVYSHYSWELECIYGDRWRSQTFTADKSGNLNKVTLRCKCDLGSPSPLVVEIRDALIDGKPGNTVYGSVEKTCTEIGSDYSYYNFSFNVPITSGTKYSIVFHTKDNGGDVDNRYRFKHQSGDPYGDGSRYESDDNGSSWSVKTWDYYFQTYVLIPAGYIPSGNLISSAFDASSIVSWKKIFWSTDIPAGTSVKFRTRTSPDGSSWSLWSDNYTVNGSSITNPDNRWIQYQAILETTDITQTPILHDVTIYYR
jgi:hypothetical protein